MADVEKAFLQISLPEKDRDYVRFLWIKERPIDGKEIEIEHYRMTRVLFGVTSSPFLLALTLRYHFSKWKIQYPEVCEQLNEDLYVDDFISGAEEEQEARRICMQSTEIMSAAGMNLRKWVTNSPALEDIMGENSNEAKSLTPTNVLTPPTTPLKVLGLTWNAKADDLSFDISGLLEFLETRQNTKRSILRASARVFDPIGLLSPFLIRVKCLFQELWVKGLTWDEELPPDLQEIWNQWCVELLKLQQVKTPRWYLSNGDGMKIVEKQLHAFSDASEKAYGAVIYLRYTTESGTIGVAIVASKTRVAPLKRLTLPRLELMGAVIAARLLRYVIKALSAEGDRYQCWTDSTIVVQWIHGMARNWKPFVGNRISEIQELTNPRAWAHCSGKSNPADQPSRGLKIEELIESRLWWHGPTWLEEDEKFWPSDRVSENDEVVDNERRTTVQVSCATDNFPKSLVNIENYSSLNRLVRITAWILRFIRNIKEKGTSKIVGSLTAEELNKAELHWIKQVQEECFANEMAALRLGHRIRQDSTVISLNPLYDNGIMRVGGRLQHSDLNYQEKHPIILPARHKFTELIVKQKHEMILHAGLNDTLIQVRESFWILKGRQLVKKVIQRCLICRRYRVTRGAEITAPLPSNRVTQSPPFEVTGLDFAGPLYVKGVDSLEKVYVALFTCAVTRAIHLELVTDMSTEKFLLAFRRFIARRGICRQIYSDNARTFKRADKDLNKLLNSVETDKFQNLLGHRRITWSYIVERAAWWGGFWERLVRSVKSSLKKVLGKGLLSLEELNTVITEVEAVLNSRPLTVTPNEASEPSPLTPSHFIIGHRITALPQSDLGKASTPVAASKEQLTRRLRYRETILRHFWKRWRQEYLMELRSAHNSRSPKNVRRINENDVVLIEDKMLPRQVWKMGRVLKVFPGRDGKVRACEVKFPGGTVLRRPVQLLYPMELEIA